MANRTPAITAPERLVEIDLEERATALLREHRWAEALWLLDELERHFRSVGLQDELQRCLGNKGVILRTLRDEEGALRLHREEAAICRATGDQAGLEISLANQLLILDLLDDHESIASLHAEQVALYRSSGNLPGLVVSLANEALRLARVGRASEGIPKIDEARRIALAVQMVRYLPRMEEAWRILQERVEAEAATAEPASTRDGPASGVRSSDLAFETHGSISEIPQQAWDALQAEQARPFLDWEYLRVLEKSGAVGPARGWAPRHVALWRGSTLVAAMAAYRHTADGIVTDGSPPRSYSPNDTDWSGFPRFKYRGYPKLVLAVPFSSGVGVRPLVAEGEDRRDLSVRLLRDTQRLASADGCTGVHVLFAREADMQALGDAGFEAGTISGCYVWRNRPFSSYQAFLDSLGRQRRRNVVAERSRIARAGIEIATLSGDELTPEVMEFVIRCHEANIGKHRTDSQRLPPSFFRLAGERLRHLVEVVIAKQGDRWLGTAFNLRGRDGLFGRFWGAVEPVPLLQFNVCYDHTIERCIVDGTPMFDAGIGGKCKGRRGFERCVARGGHWFVERR